MDFDEQEWWRVWSSRPYRTLCAEREPRWREKKERPKPGFTAGSKQRSRVRHPGCEEPGEFRAPPADGPVRGDGPPPFRWFCLDHVRAFNARYNFFDGMSADEIHEAQRPMAGWEADARLPTGGADRAAALGRFRRSPGRDRRAVPRAGGDAERKDGKPLSGADRERCARWGWSRRRPRALRRRYSDWCAAITRTAMAATAATSRARQGDRGLSAAGVPALPNSSDADHARYGGGAVRSESGDCARARCTSPSGSLSPPPRKALPTMKRRTGQDEHHRRSGAPPR